MPEQENMTTEERIQKIREETERINQRVATMKEEREGSWKELSKEIAKVNATAAKLTKKTKEHGKQIGGYGNRLGYYTEARAEPSIRRILDEHFDADYMEAYESRSMQLDGWAVARNGSGAAYIVEIKSRFAPEHLDQVWELVRVFRAVKREFESSPVYPILAVVNIDREQRELVWQSGIHLIDVSDGALEWTRPPMGFRPCGDHGANGVVQRAVPRHLRLVTDKG